MKKNLDFYCFVTSSLLFIFEEWCKCTFEEWCKCTFKKEYLSIKLRRKIIFRWRLDGHWQKEQDPVPDPLLKRTDPRIRIRICTKMSRSWILLSNVRTRGSGSGSVPKMSQIRITALHLCFVFSSTISKCRGATSTLTGCTSAWSPSSALFPSRLYPTNRYKVSTYYTSHPECTLCENIFGRCIFSEKFPFLYLVFRIRIRHYLYGSRSGSGSDSGSGSFHQEVKKLQLWLQLFATSYWLLSLKADVNVPTVSNKCTDPRIRTRLIMSRIQNTASIKYSAKMAKSFSVKLTLSS